MKIRFKWFDLWIGAYIDRKKRTVYICPLPCVVFILGGVDYFSAKKRSQRAACKTIDLCQKMTERDRREMAAYFECHANDFPDKDPAS